MKLMKQRFQIFQKVVTIDGPGFICGINFGKRVCDVSSQSGQKTYLFKDIVKFNSYYSFVLI